MKNIETKYLIYAIAWIVSAMVTTFAVYLTKDNSALWLMVFPTIYKISDEIKEEHTNEYEVSKDNFEE